MKHSIKFPKHLIRKLLALFVTGLICVVTYYFVHNLSKYVPIYSGDDLRYGYVYHGGSPASMPRITTLSQFIKSVVFHFLWWNARFPAIVGEMIAPMLKQTTFSIITSVFYLLTGLMINLTALGRKVLIRPHLLALTYLMMWLLIPGFGMAVLWHSGAPNYLWIVPIYLLFLLPYIYNSKPKYPAFRFFFVVIMGILAGTSNELAGPQVIIVAFLLSFFDNKNFEADWKWVGLITASVAAFIAIFRDMIGGESAGAYGTGKVSLGEISQNTLHFLGLIILIDILLVAFLIVYRKVQTDEMLPFKIHRHLFIGVVFMIGGFAGIGALVISPVIKGTTMFSDYIFFMVAFVNLVQAVLEIRHRQLVYHLFLGFVALGLIFIAFPKYETYLSTVQKQSNLVYTGTQLGLQAQKDKEKNKELAIPDLGYLADDSPFAGGYVGWYSKTNFMNIWYERKYGVKKVTLGYKGEILANPVTPDLFVVAVEGVYNTYLNPTMQKIANWWYALESGATRVSAETKKRTTTPKVKSVVDNQVNTNPAMRELIIYFYNPQGENVGKQQILSYPGTNFDISWLRVTGYHLGASAPRRYKFTSAKEQTLSIRVYPNRQTFTIQYNLGEKALSSELVEGFTGEKIPAHLPYGYKAARAKALSQKIPATQSSEALVIQVVQKPFWQRLPEFWPFYLILFVFGVFLALDRTVLVLEKSKEGKSVG